MGTTRSKRWEKSLVRSPRKKHVEVHVRRDENPEGGPVLVGHLTHRGRQLSTGKSVQIPGLNHSLPIIEHRSLGLLTIGITVRAPEDDFERLLGRRKWNLLGA